MEDFSQELCKKIDTGVVNGLNQVARMALTDITLHVQVRTGRLQASWAIIQYATPGNWEVKLDSPLNYRRIHYPFQIPKKIPKERNRALKGNPLLKDGDSTAFQEQAKNLIEEGLSVQFRD